MEIHEKRKKLKDLYGKHAKEWRRKVSNMTSKQVYAIYESMEERGYFDKRTENGKKVELVKYQIDIAKKEPPHQFNMFELGLLKKEIDMDEDKLFITKEDGTVVVQHVNKLAEIVGNAMGYVSNISATPGGIIYTRNEAEKALKELRFIYQEIMVYDPQR